MIFLKHKGVKIWDESFNGVNTTGVIFEVCWGANYENGIHLQIQEGGYELFVKRTKSRAASSFT